MDNTEKGEDKSLTRVIGEGVAMYSAGSIVNKFSGLATSLVKIKFLTVFQYGLLSLTTTAVYFINGIVTMGIGEVVTADLNRVKGEGRMDVYKGLLIGYIKAISFFAIIFWILLFFGTDLLGKYYDNSVLPYIKLFSFIIIVTPLRTLYTTIFQTHLKFKYLVNWSILESYVNLVLVVVLVWLFDFGIKGVIYAELTYHVISLIIFGPFVFRIGSYLLKQKRSSQNHFWVTVKEHGKWAIFTGYLGDFTKKIRPWFIAFFLNVEAVAIFSVAQSFYNHLTSLLSINSVLAQIFPQQIKDKVKTGEIFHRTFKYSLYVFIAIGIGGLVVVPWLVDWLFPKYHDSLFIFRMLILIMPIMSLVVLQTPVYNAMQKQKDLFILTVSKNIVMVVLSVILVPLYGLLGSAVENIITMYFYVLTRYFNMKRIVPEVAVNWKNLFVFDDVDRDIFKKIGIHIGVSK